MNKNLTNAIYDIAKVEALMYAIENTYLDFEFSSEERMKAEHGVNTFYALWDAVKKVSEDLDNLAGDESVVDAIYAVNDVKRRSVL